MAYPQSVINPARKVNTDNRYDVAVVGGGMVGTTCAALLARDGLRVCVIEGNALPTWDSSGSYPRVSAINLASTEVFRTLGVWDQVLARGACPYRCMEVWEKDSNARIRFDSLEHGQAQLGHIVPNDAITTSLLEKLDHNFNVSLMAQCTVTAITASQQAMVIELDDGETVNCDLVVGADGAKSRIRELAGIHTEITDYEQDAIVTTVDLAAPHQHTAWQSFQTSGPAALLPLLDGRCSVVWSCDRPFADEVMSYDDKRLCGALSEIFSARPAEIIGCTRPIRFPLNQHHAETYIAPGTVLVGDAAHVTHPLAGPWTSSGSGRTRRRSRGPSG